MPPRGASLPKPPEARRWTGAQSGRRIDPYKHPGKLVAPTVCPQCGALYRSGRWQWGPRPAEANETICQACHRSNDKRPAGVVTLTGSFVRPNRPEIVRVAAGAVAESARAAGERARGARWKQGKQRDRCRRGAAPHGSRHPRPRFRRGRILYPGELASRHMSRRSARRPLNTKAT